MDKLTDKQIEILERELAKEYAQAKKEMQKKLESQMKTFKALDSKKQSQVAKGKLSQDAYDKWRRGQLLHSKWMKDMVKSYSDFQVSTNKKAAEIINKGLPTLFDESFLHSAFDISKQTGIDFALHNKKAIEGLVDKRNELLPKSRVDIPKDRRWNQNKMRSALTQGVLQGESVDKIAGRLRDVTDMNGRVALRNARTMANAASNAGLYESYLEAEAMGIPIDKMWQSAIDARTRESHVHLDGMKIPLKALFPNGLLYPGDPDGAPGEVYNCRCRLSCQIRGFERNMSDLSNRAHKLGDMSYEEWKAGKDLQKKSSSAVVDGKDISDEWKRRADKFEFEIDDIINAQGFDGLPTIVNADEFDAAVQKSNFIAQRTYSAPNQEILDGYRDQLYNGKWYVDCSNGGARFGQGMYTAGNYGTELSKRTIAEMGSYENPKALNRIETLTLSENAKFVKYDDLIKQYEADNKKFKDVGSYAVAKGYDVIIARENKFGFYAIILNRTKVVIKRS